MDKCLEDTQIVWRAGVERVRGDLATEHALKARDQDPVWILGAGKATAWMAQGAERVFGDRVAGGLIAVKKGHALPLGKIEIIETGHPVPDEASLLAGERMLELAQKIPHGARVLGLISGGASACLEALQPGVSLESLQRETQRLLRSGVSIDVLNHTRMKMSRIKCGGLARALAHTRLEVLVIPDVPGDDLNIVGSGPFWTEDQAMRPLHQAVARSSDAVRAAAEYAERLGYTVIVSDAKALTGEARINAAQWVAQIGEHLKKAQTLKGRMVWVLGGETTVTVSGSGRGGRNQEWALSAQIEWEKLTREAAEIPNLSCISAGTDGSDGPTAAAGAFWGSQNKLTPSAQESLDQNDSFTYFEQEGGLFYTGPTGTNVMDLVVVCVSGSVSH